MERLAVALCIELAHPTDPRFLFLSPGAELPERITPEDAFSGRYGRLAIFAPHVDLVYSQPDGPGTDWVRP